jgi:hypothetical protein
LNQRIKEAGSLENFKDEVERAISESLFLQGENNRNWRCNFDFILSHEKFTKMREGAYKRVSKAQSDYEKVMNMDFNTQTGE